MYVFSSSSSFDIWTKILVMFCVMYSHHIGSQIYIHNPEDISLSWNQPSSVPICLSSQLEVFEWIEYGDSIEEDEFLTYVFANSKCLKTATISVSPTVQILEDQDLIFEELKDIPRVSTASQLLLK